MVLCGALMGAQNGLKPVSFPSNSERRIVDKGNGIGSPLITMVFRESIQNSTHNPGKTVGEHILQSLFTIT